MITVGTLAPAGIAMQNSKSKNRKVANSPAFLSDGHMSSVYPGPVDKTTDLTLDSPVRTRIMLNPGLPKQATTSMHE